MVSEYQVVTKLKLADGTIIDGDSLDMKDRLAFIEFAIHLAAPLIARKIIEDFNQPIVKETSPNKHDNLYFELPPTLTPKEVAEYLRVSVSTIYEMCRRWNGKFFPHVKVGNRIIIPRDKLIEWLDVGGIEGYKKKVGEADREFETGKRKNNLNLGGEK